MRISIGQRGHSRPARRHGVMLGAGLSLSKAAVFNDFEVIFHCIRVNPPNANRSKGQSAYDRTRYGRTRASLTSVVTHHTDHTQQISLGGSILNDVEAILQCTLSRKQTACSCAPSATGAAHVVSGVWRA